MKKQASKSLLALLSVITLVSCGGTSTTEEDDTEPAVTDTLAICAYNGGYGTDWLEQLADDFFAETGILVTTEVDSTIINKMESQLKTPDYDIYMSHGLYWQDFANRDLLANLDDVYSSTLDDGRTFANTLVDTGAELSRYYNYEKNETHYYKVPFTQGVGGLVYNVDMFKQYGWSIPTTYDELVTLCATILKDTNNQVTPFAWSGDRDYYWDYIIYEWWAELAGKEEFQSWMNMSDSNGDYSKGYTNWDASGRGKYFKEAYSMWYNLVAKNPSYSNDSARNTPLATAQSLFFNGKAAMIPYAQWAKKEIEKAQKKEFTFDIAMMKTPTVKKDSTNINFMVGFGDSIIVPKKSPNLANAKKFLQFLAKASSRKTFVEKADGPFLGFTYNDVDMSDIEANDTYIKSIHDILDDSVNVSTASNNPLVVANLDTYLQPWINNVRFYKEASGDPENTNYAPDAVFNTMLKTASDNWNSWYRAAQDYIDQE